MTQRRLTSRRVALTAAFLTLAAGGTAACDTSGTEDLGYDTSGPGPADAGGPAPTATAASPPVPTPRASASATRTSSPRVPSQRPPSQRPPTPGPQPPPGAAGSAAEPGADDIFYCADQTGTVVNEENCDVDDSGGTYFLYYSAAYLGGYGVGSVLPPGGGRFYHHDQAARARYGLPADGTVPNGSIKTNIVGGGGSSADGGSAGG